MACTKVPFVSRGEAEHARRSMTTARTSGGKLTIYRCSEEHEGYFHLGHKDTHKARRAAMLARTS